MKGDEIFRDYDPQGQNRVPEQIFYRILTNVKMDCRIFSANFRVVALKLTQLIRPSCQTIDFLQYLTCRCLLSEDTVLFALSLHLLLLSLYILRISTYNYMALFDVA